MLYNEYISTTLDNPNQYYWSQINKSLNAMTQKEATKTRWINHFNELLGKEAYKLGVAIDDKKMNAQLAFKACQAVLLEMVLTFGKPPHVAYALEYFEYAPTIFDLGESPRTVNLNQNCYYNRLLDRLEMTLLTECNSAILNNTSSSSVSSNIIDLDKLRRDLRQIVATFYANSPELKESTNHMPELQKTITRLFSNLSLEFNKKSQANKSSMYPNTRFTNF